MTNATKRPRGQPDALRIHLLGGLRIDAGGREIGEGGWRIRKARTLIALLALAPGHRLHREQLMDLLWPELDPAAAGTNLRYALFVARRTLDPGAGEAGRYLRAEGDALVLAAPAGLWVDAVAFRMAAVEARRAQTPEAYQAALALYRGDLLPEDRYEDWADSEREELRGQHVTLLLELARLHERRAEPEPAIDALRRLVAAEPAHEGAHASLMRLYARTGQRSLALRQYRLMVEALREELGAEPEPSSRDLYQEILTARYPPAPAAELAPGRPRTNLPHLLSSFVGREREMAEVRELLAGTRLLTLAGPGGCGKTRLAIELGAALLADYPDGVWLADLEPISDPALVLYTTAAALGLRGQTEGTAATAIEEELSTRRLLLILDNCEHLLDPCARLAERLLRICPHLTVLATSREPLGIMGETIWRVPSLSLPPAGGDVSDALAASDAGRLFLERASAYSTGFAVTAGNAAAITEICRRLDGIPLALELAAARVRSMPVEEIAARLDGRLDLLVGGAAALPRHRTLRAAIDWSYELLSPDEQAVFRRLGVFAGSFGLEAIEAVCGGRAAAGVPLTKKPEQPKASSGPSVPLVLVLSSLVDRSLVVLDEAPQAARYRLLETLRSYALEQLDVAGESTAIRDRHRDWYLELAEFGEAPTWGGPKQGEWVTRLDAEHDNLRAAIGWSLERGDASTGLRIAAALGRFWEVRGYLDEGRRRLDAALNAVTTHPDTLRARALNAAGRLAVLQADWPSVEASVPEALALFRALDDRIGIAISLLTLGNAAVHQRQLARAETLLEECVERFTALRQPLGVAAALVDLADLAMVRDQFEQAEQLIGRALATFEAVGDLRGKATLLSNLGEVAEKRDNHALARSYMSRALAQAREMGDRANVARYTGHLARIAFRFGDYAGALHLYREALALQRGVGDRRLIAIFLARLGELAAREGMPELALRLAGAAANVRPSAGDSRLPDLPTELPPLLRAARDALSEEAAAGAWLSGWVLEPAQAINVALESELRD